MMHKNVFSKKSFILEASKDFILVELDFPNGNPEVKKKNAPYADKYKIEGFPTVVLFDKDAKEFTRFVASKYPSTSKFLAHLKSSLARKNLE
jgi:thioredoxin-related protein